MSEALVLTLLREGVAAARAGDRQRARRLLGRVTESDPGNELAWLRLAGVAERPHDTAAHLERVLALNPNSDRAREGLRTALLQAGVADARAGNLPSARRYLDAAAQADPGKELAWLWLASVAESPHHAARAYERALAANPASDKARGKLIIAHLEAAALDIQAGQRPQAREHLLAATRLDAGRQSAWLSLAELADSPREAVGYLDRLLALEPTHARGRELLALHQARLAPGEAPSDPCPACGALLELNDPEVLFRHRAANPALLRQAIGRPLDRLPGEDDFATHSWLGLAHANLGQLPEALHHLCKFIKHSPEAKHVPVVMLSGKGGFFDKIRGRLAGATAYLTKPFDPEALVLAVDQQSDRFWGLKSRGPTATSPSRSPTRSYSPASIGSSEKPDRGSARAQRRADLPGGTHGR